MLQSSSYKVLEGRLVDYKPQVSNVRIYVNALSYAQIQIIVCEDYLTGQHGTDKQRPCMICNRVNVRLTDLCLPISLPTIENKRVKFSKIAINYSYI